MMMYDTITFTSVVAWVAFVVIKVILMIVVADTLIPRTQKQKDMEKLNAAVKGYSVKTDWRKVGVLFVIWLVCGWYLFG